MLSCICWLSWFDMGEKYDHNAAQALGQIVVVGEETSGSLEINSSFSDISVSISANGHFAQREEQLSLE